MQMTTENSEGMKDGGTLNVSHVSRKPLQRIDVTTPEVGHICIIHTSVGGLTQNKDNRIRIQQIC